MKNKVVARYADGRMVKRLASADSLPVQTSLNDLDQAVDVLLRVEQVRRHTDVALTKADDDLLVAERFKQPLRGLRCVP